MKLEYIVKENDVGKKIKDILLTNLSMSHRLLITLKKNNLIYLNDSLSFVYNTVSKDDKITVDLGYEEDNSNIVSKKMDLDIIYEDDWYLIINKPAGIPVHPSFSHYEDSLSSGIKYYFDSIGLKKKIRPVNRIDKDTSGLVVFAKNEYIQECLIHQMKNNNFYKEYIAICEGIFENKKSEINAPIARKENSIIQRCIDKQGDNAITCYEVLEESSVIKEKIPIYYSVVKCILKTGRTHQIRVHMSYINHPLLGDDLYNGSTYLINRQALHSYKIIFTHPITKIKVEYIAKIPADLKPFININTYLKN